MTIIGNIKEFAIQWELTSVYKDECYGSIIFWIGEEKIGDYEKETKIDFCINGFKEFNKHKSVRTYKDSHLLSKEALYFQLHEKFFGEEAIKNGDYLNFGICRAIFSLVETGHLSFMDTLNIIIVDEPCLNRQRFIWCYYDKNDEKKEFFIDMNTFEEVASRFCDQASLEWENLLVLKNSS